MKKFLALLLALVMVFALAACGQDAPETTEPAGDDDSVTSDAPVSDAPETAGIPLEEIKVGFIFLHDENSTYDLNFINAAKAPARLWAFPRTSTSCAPTSPRARSAMTPPPTSPMTAATSSLPTASAMRIS